MSETLKQKLIRLAAEGRVEHCRTDHGRMGAIGGKVPTRTTAKTDAGWGMGTGALAAARMKRRKMNTEERLKELGFDDSQIEYLCGMARDVYPPSDFDEEVQAYMEEENER